MNVFLEVNNYCELKCRFCIADLGYKYPKANISMDMINEIILKYKEHEPKAVFITGGEPLLHPNITQIVEQFASNDYYTYVTTNGQKFQNEEFAVKFMMSGIHRIAIPVYGSSAEIYDTMTGIDGSFETLKNALDNIFYIKDKYMPHVKIELRLLMAKYNIEHNKDTIEWIINNYPSVDYISFLGLQLSSRTNNYEKMIEISMTEAAPYLRECLDRIREEKIKCVIAGIPICILGEDYSDFYSCKVNKGDEQISLFPHLSIQPHLKQISEGQYRESSSKMKSSSICPKCKYFFTCDGVQERYVKKYGFSDLKTIY